MQPLPPDQPNFQAPAHSFLSGGQKEEIVELAESSHNDRSRGGFGGNSSGFGGSSSGTRARPISVDSMDGGEQTWECLQCTFHNHEMMEKCEICDAPKAGKHPALRPGHTATRNKPLPPNPPRFANGVKDQPLGWGCTVCGTYMENQWWTCSQCGTMKVSS